MSVQTVTVGAPGPAGPKTDPGCLVITITPEGDTR